MKRAERRASTLGEGLAHVRRREHKAALLMRAARHREAAVPAVNAGGGTAVAARPST